MAVPHRVTESREEAAVSPEVVSFTPKPLPVRYYDQDTSRPVSFYLSSLEDLLAWTPSGEDSFNVALEPRASRQPPLSSPRPRTLLCHDMMGGYLDDRFIQGCEAQYPYSFYHWQYIDTFVYFSHHLVTIPPVGWTNSAHRHGVYMLGTFITEWTNGALLCESFLAGHESSYQAVADKLVQVAQFFRFDGWLINIENSLSLAAVKNLPSFLRYLTAQLHQQVPGGQVLWYDSVVDNGQLKWQNELNEHNKAFFDSCDGFFTNYNWHKEHLQRMRGLAGDRLADVYVGVDVFGRGDVIGGGFDTVKSLELIRKHNFSVALFAPGWVYERLDKAEFFQNQDRFWSLLEPYLPTHSICSLPFVTSFCLGLGPRRVCYGEEEAPGPWYHLSAQELQPLFGEHRPGGGLGWVKTHCCLADAWHGGTSLLVRGRIPPEEGSVAVRLFTLHMPAPPSLLLSLVYKLERPKVLGVALELTTAPTGMSGISVPNETRHSLQPLSNPPHKLSRCGHFRRSLSGGWIQRCFEVSLQACVLRDLCVRFSRPPGSQHEDFACRLGEIQVLDANSLLAPLSQVQAVAVAQVSWQQVAEGSRLRLSCTLHWSHSLSQVRHYRIHCQTEDTPARDPDPDQPVLLGLAFANQYRVTKLSVKSVGPGQEARVVFLVEPVPREGFQVPEDEWGRATLLYTMPTTGHP
ncbi:cytosolic endo-beta-N-acetylglucosaminidase isoform X1 [Suncus etruscus]|uniref:cytosolic endo-beta-N-acetylglucosaminidase isoform X1 n=2 Tax=Suncus etruscus TaxID=109475 RepID=UPI00210F4663|nr:cytosolic endo-beta-N-acetylglucosaminidase isoform X1 [Suncus etruscus]